MTGGILLTDDDRVGMTHGVRRGDTIWLLAGRTVTDVITRGATNIPLDKPFHVTESGWYVYDSEKRTMRLVAIFEVTADDGRLMVAVHRDGSIQYGPAYDPDEAARRFWRAILAYMPPHLVT